MGGLWLAVLFFPGISLSSGGALLAATIVLMALHFALRPILLLLAFPLIVLTLGFGIILVNALLFYFSAFLVQGFVVDGFGWALLGGLVLSFVSIFVKLWFGIQIIDSSQASRGLHVKVRKNTSHRPPPRKQTKNKDDDVIDI